MANKRSKSRGRRSKRKPKKNKEKSKDGGIVNPEERKDGEKTKEPKRNDRKENTKSKSPQKRKGEEEREPSRPLKLLKLDNNEAMFSWERFRKERLKREKKLLEDLPMTQEKTDYENPSQAVVELSKGWWVNDRDDLVAEALQHCDPGGEVSHQQDTSYDEDKARELLFDYGHADVQHFMKKHKERLEDDDAGDYGEVGWNVRISIRSIGLKEARKLVDRIVFRMATIDDCTVQEGDLSQLSSDASAIREKALSLLNDENAQVSSIQYAFLERCYRHTCYPAGGTDDSIMWLTTNNRPVELRGKYGFERN